MCQLHGAIICPLSVHDAHLPHQSVCELLFVGRCGVAKLLVLLVLHGYLGQKMALKFVHDIGVISIGCIMLIIFKTINPFSEEWLV